MMDKGLEKYTRQEFTMAESIYKDYKSMRATVNAIQKLKYDIEDDTLYTPEFKAGFIAGVKVMSSIFLDL